MSKIKEQGIDLRLTIAGDGENVYLEELNKLINELGLNKQIEFVGFVRGKEVGR